MLICLCPGFLLRMHTFFMPFLYYFMVGGCGFSVGETVPVRVVFISVVCAISADETEENSCLCHFLQHLLRVRKFFIIIVRTFAATNEQSNPYQPGN